MPDLFVLTRTVSSNFCNSERSRSDVELASQAIDDVEGTMKTSSTGRTRNQIAFLGKSRSG